MNGELERKIREVFTDRISIDSSIEMPILEVVAEAKKDILNSISECCVFGLNNDLQQRSSDLNKLWETILRWLGND